MRWPRPARYAEHLILRGTLLPNPANDNVQSRGLRRAAAARYLGISSSHSTSNVRPATFGAETMLGVVLWDRQDLDRLFDGVSVANDDDDGYRDKACGSESLNS